MRASLRTSHWFWTTKTRKSTVFRLQLSRKCCENAYCIHTWFKYECTAGEWRRNKKWNSSASLNCDPKKLWKGWRLLGVLRSVSWDFHLKVDAVASTADTRCKDLHTFFFIVSTVIMFLAKDLIPNYPGRDSLCFQILSTKLWMDARIILTKLCAHSKIPSPLFLFFKLWENYKMLMWCYPTDWL